jgi:hypothetical protein
VSELSTQLLSLVIALMGFGIIVSLLIGGANGPKKFLGCLFAPLRWMTWGVLVGLVVLVGLAFLLSLLPGILPQFPGLSGWPKLPGSGSSSTQPPAGPQQSTILLDRYPMLTQRDVSIYSSESFAPPPNHYVMAVGYERDTKRILYNDPWYNESADSWPGFADTQTNPGLHRLPTYKVTKMLVTTKIPVSR